MSSTDPPIIQELRTVNAFSWIKLCFLTGGLALGNQILMKDACFPIWLQMLWRTCRTRKAVARNTDSQQECDVHWSFGSTLPVLVVSDLSSQQIWSVRIWRISAVLIGERSLCKLDAWFEKRWLNVDWSTRCSRSKLALKMVSAWNNGTPDVYRQWQVWFDEAYLDLAHHTLGP